MKAYLGPLVLALLSSHALASDLGSDVGAFLKDPIRQLQKSRAIKVGARPFNRDLNDQNRPKAGEFWLAVVGDSSTTGAAASPHFQATWLNLLGHIAEAVKNISGPDLGPDENLPPPFRVLYTQDEFDQAVHDGEALELNVQADLSKKVDTEEYSFGYLLGRKIGLSQDRIVLTGQDGSQVSSLATQFQRAIFAGPGTLPPLVIASYVANDLCAPKNFSEPPEVFRREFQAEVKEQLTRVAGFPAAKPQGTRVVFLAPLDVANVLTNEALLDQKIRFENNSTITCRQLREGKVGGGELGKSMQSALVGECRGVLAKTEYPERKLAQLRNLQTIQAEVFQEEIGALNALGRPIHAEYAGSIKDIDFQTGDLANDCFHPSRAGADRIAEQLLSHELNDLRR